MTSRLTCTSPSSTSRGCSTPLDSRGWPDFVAALDAVNAVADAAPGSSGGCRTSPATRPTLRPWGDDVIVNMSVWESVRAALRAYVFGAEHVAVLRRRREWFEP